MKLKTLASLSILGSLMGCSSMLPGDSLGTPNARPGAAVPVKMALSPPVGTAMAEHEVLYVTGRSAHGVGHFARAVAYYERTLAIKPDHLGALNALGVLHAQEGRTAEALALFDRARVLEPLAAHVHNNMGYALLHAKRLKEAELTLRVARQLDPNSLQILENLDLLAKAEIEHDERNQPTSESLQAGESIAAQNADHPAGPHLVAVAPNVFELRTAGPQAIEAMASSQAAAAELSANEPEAQPQALALSRKLTAGEPAVAQVEQPRPALIEVSNGTGAPRLARRTANKLAPTGVFATRLTNARSFKQSKTLVQYLAGQESVVDALLASLPMPVQAVQVAALVGGAQVRLVLGHDGAGKAIALWAQPDTSRFAAAGLKRNL